MQMLLLYSFCNLWHKLKNWWKKWYFEICSCNNHAVILHHLLVYTFLLVALTNRNNSYRNTAIKKWYFTFFMSHIFYSIYCNIICITLNIFKEFPDWTKYHISCKLLQNTSRESRYHDNYIRSKAIIIRVPESHILWVLSFREGRR